MDKTLFDAAQNVLKNAHVPYSKFQVGAALKLKDGTIITGINVENASYGLSNCAERTALFTAYTQGYKKADFESILVTTNQAHIVSPCGACRQVMRELLDDDVDVILANKDGKTQKMKNKDLLPFAFTEGDL